MPTNGVPSTSADVELPLVALDGDARPPRAGRRGSRARGRSRCRGPPGGSRARRPCRQSAPAIGRPGRRRRAPRPSRRCAAARAASSRACSRLRVSTVAVRARRGGRARPGPRAGARAARPPADAGFTSSAKRRVTRPRRRRLRAARSAANSPRSAPRRPCPPSNLRMSARATTSSPSSRSACGSSMSFGSRTSSTSCCDGVPRLVGRRFSDATSSCPGRESQCSSKMPEPVGVQALAVREQEVQAGEGRALDAPVAIRRSEADRVAGVVVRASGS